VSTNNGGHYCEEIWAVNLISQRLKRPDAALKMVQGLAAAETPAATAKLANLKETSQCLALIERADLRPRSLAVLLSCDALAGLIECQPDQINTDELIIEAPFRMRRRGVELKLHLGDAPPELDRTLIRNIVKARRWLKMIIEGKTFAGIAEAESTSKRRVQDVVDLALLAPAVLDAIGSGDQPDGLTTDYLIKTGFSEVWSQQKKQFAEI
jgi:site-specific DNA recombinase